MKRMFSLMLCFAMALSLFAMPANAADPAQFVGGTTAVDKNDAIMGEFFAFVGVEGEVVDYDNWTITRPDGTVLVFDPDTFIWTRTEANGTVSTIQANKPPYWYEDGKLIETATNKVVNDIAEDMKPQYKPEETTTPAPAQTPAPVPSATPAPVDKAQYFDDVAENAWYAEAVNAMAASGIINGYDDGLFHPENNVTVGELCTIIYRIGKNENVSNKPVPDHPEYTHWASYAVWILFNGKGYIQCSPARADELANRGETLTAIMAFIKEAKLIEKGKYAKIHDYDEHNATEIPDWDVITGPDYKPGWQHSWNYQMIVKAYNYGIINGIDAAGTFNPKGTLTRAELCQMLYNAGLTQYTPVEFKDRNASLGFMFGG